MRNKEYIAFKGDKFTIEWYYDYQGKSPALDYFSELTDEEQSYVLRLFEFMAKRGEIRSKEKFNYEGDQIYAFKPQPDRFLCFFREGKKIIVTNAFRKKQDKLPKGEKEKALKNKRDYEIRAKEGSYYD